jgi:hypothetical protein
MTESDLPARLAPLPEYLLAMARRLPPGAAPVVPGSTPVVAFGDPALAEVATLGINPSANEFLQDGRLLTGKQRRLATLESLGAQRLDQLTEAQVATIVADCATYFQRQPYRRWFDPLDELLHVGADASYYDGSGCHLDLVQWATRPMWGEIADPGVRRALLDDGVPHLRNQLAWENVRLVLLNGRQVIDQVVAVGLADLDEVGHLPLARGTCRLYAGTGGGVRWVAWSTNLQSSWGVSKAFKQDLGAWLAQVCTPPTEPRMPAAPIPTPETDTDSHLPRGLRVAGKTELVNALRRWLAESRAPTLGEVGAFGGRAWLLIDLADQQVALNADTKRTAIETFVRDNTADPERPWWVVANRRGRLNKVLPGPSPEPLPGWYAYLIRPLSQEGVI